MIPRLPLGLSNLIEKNKLIILYLTNQQVPKILYSEISSRPFFQTKPESAPEQQESGSHGAEEPFDKSGRDYSSAQGEFLLS